MTTTNTGRVNVSKETITFQNLLGTTTIDRHKIQKLVHINGFTKYLTAIIRIVFLVTIIQGIRLLFTPAMVEIYVYGNPRAKRIWFSSKEEYEQFCRAL